MRNILFIFFILNCIATNIRAQEKQNFSIILKRADRYFDEGKLDTIPFLLRDYAKKGNRLEQRQALVLLTKVHLFQDNDSAAEQTMKTLLRSEPYYTPAAGEPLDLEYFANEFRNKPYISLGFKTGAAFPQIRQDAQLPIQYNTLQGSKKSAIKWGSSLPRVAYGGVELTTFLLRYFELGISYLYQPRTIAYQYFLQDQSPSYNNTTLTIIAAQENQTWSDISTTIAAQVLLKKRVAPFLFYGKTWHLLHQAELTIPTISGNDQVIDITTLRHNMISSDMLGLGAKIRAQNHFFKISIAHRWFDASVVKPNTLFADPYLNYQYGFIDHIFRMNEWITQVGFHYHLYDATRKRRKTASKKFFF